jgi:hypothetical protein
MVGFFSLFFSWFFVLFCLRCYVMFYFVFVLFCLRCYVMFYFVFVLLLFGFCSSIFCYFIPLLIITFPQKSQRQKYFDSKYKKSKLLSPLCSTRKLSNSGCVSVLKRCKWLWELYTWLLKCDVRFIEGMIYNADNIDFL